MTRLLDETSRLVGSVATLRTTLQLSMPLFALLLLASAANAQRVVDWNVATGDTAVGTNWIDNLAATGVPTSADQAFIRNGGTATMTSDLNALTLRLGFSKLVPDPVDPLLTIDVGASGQLDWSAGVLNTPDLRVGSTFTGIVNQSGGSLTLPSTSTLTIGSDGSALTMSPNSIYTLSDGLIAMAFNSSGNNGVNVRHGTFTMTGGSITQAVGASVQRVMRIASTSDATGLATVSGGTIDASGGIRIADSDRTIGTLNVSGATTSIKLGGDLAIGRNATSTGTMNMSGGLVTLDHPTLTDPRLQVGDSGPGTLNMSGGTINVVGRDIRVMNNDEASGSLLNMTGGTINTVGIDMHIEAYTLPGTDLGGRILVNGPTASFNSNSGTAIIGNTGPATFEVQSGNASLTGVQLGQTATSAPRIIVGGGKLKITGNVLKTSLVSVTPDIQLTGGELELDIAGTTLSWPTNLPINGSLLDLKPTAAGSLLRVNVGDATHPAAFTMNSGTWDIDVGAAALTIDSADRVFVTGGMGSILGGTLNIIHQPGYTPSVGDIVRIVRSPLGVALSNTVNVTGDPNWIVRTGAAGLEIQLEYVPEPTAISLLAIAGLALVRRRRA